MKFNKKSILKRSPLCLFICLFCAFSTTIYATNADYSERIVLANVIPNTFGTIVCSNTLLFNIDTVPKYRHYKKSKKWEILFDGKSTGKWRSLDSDTFPTNGWAIEKGSLFVKNHQEGEDIITREIYSSFDLMFDFKLTYGANSGIKYSVEKIKNNSIGKMVWNGPEYQIIDDYNHPEVKNNQHPMGSTAALYLLYAPENKKLLPAGQWNRGRIIAKGNHVEHWLNGVKVVSYERGTKDFRDRIAITKFSHYDNYGELTGGHIMLTDHDGDRVDFRNIKIKRLE